MCRFCRAVKVRLVLYGGPTRSDRIASRLICQPRNASVGGGGEGEEISAAAAIASLAMR
jgi:hypothetical protein